MEQIRLTLPSQSELPTRHLYYIDFLSHPIYLNLYETYRVVDTMVTTNGHEIVHHHRVERCPHVRFS